MSYYTTGEIAEHFQVSVRTLQYYDKKDILKPSQITESNRRIYTDKDVEKLELILLLKNMGCSLNEIKTLMNEESTMKTLNYILNVKEKTLKEDIDNKKKMIDKIESVKQYINEKSISPIIKLTDIEDMMSKTKDMKYVRKKVMLTASVIGILQYTGLISSVLLRTKKPLLIVSPFIFSYAIGLTYYYYKKVNFICPNCHTQFQPPLNKLITAKHTMKTRQLECPSCHETNFCIETPSQTL